MKKNILSVLAIIFYLCILPEDSSAIRINLYGKAGAYYQNGEWKVCPGFRLKKCASLTLSWSEVMDWLFGSAPSPNGIVDVYDEEGNTDFTISVKVISLSGTSASGTSASGTSPPDYIMGDDIIFEQQ